MKVRLIKRQSIEDYIIKNAQSRMPFEIWFSILRCAEWENTNDIISTFNSADLLGNGSNRVIFNIGGNKYRMICTYHFGRKTIHLFIKWIGTHADYTKLCKKGLQFEVDSY